MRIFSGTARGRFVNVPKGADLRPTTDKMRLAVFNAVGALVPGAHFLDCFCGSGSMGLEALSRGARLATFIDSQRVCVEAVRAASREFGFEEPRVRVFAADFRRGLAALDPAETVDLAYLDPPYRAGLGAECLGLLARSGRLAAGGAARVLLEHASEDAPPEVPGLVLLRRYRHGAGSVALYAPAPAV